MKYIIITKIKEYFKSKTLVMMILTVCFICLTINGIIILLLLSAELKNGLLTEEKQIEKNETGVFKEGVGLRGVEEVSLIVVDIGGAVRKPGIYEMRDGSRLGDLIEKAEGFDKIKSDAYFLQKNLNLAEKLIDSKKYYIPFADENFALREADTSLSSKVNTGSKTGLISINKASLKELTTLPGIGEVRGQSIIDGRPYTSVEELINKANLSQKLFEDVKNLIEI